METAREAGKFIRDFVAMVTGEDGRGHEFVTKTDTLPAVVEPDGAREVLEKAGVKFLGGVEGDPLFVHVKLPDGWKKVPAPHEWLTMLVDEKDRERARIFYKAALYDRQAALILVPRYGIYDSCYQVGWLEDGTEQEYMVCVTDGGVVLDGRKVIYDTEVIRLIGTRAEKFRATRTLIKKGEAWLDENFLDWKDPFAYWE